MEKLINKLDKLPEFIPETGGELTGWTSEKEVGKTLHSLIELTGAKTVMEIGVFRGYTSCLMADAVPKGGYTGIDIEDHRSEAVKAIMEGQESTVIIEDSLTALPKLIEQGAQFDVVFVDGNHEYSHVKPEFKLIEKLISVGGLVVFHDSMHGGIPGVKKWVDELRQYRHFEVLNLPTPDNRGLAIVKCNYQR